MKLPRAILFDNDGVLVASEPLHWAAWGELLREIGLPPCHAELQTLVGRTAPQILALLLDQHRPGWRREDYNLDALALRKNDFYLQTLRKELRANDGVKEGLEWLRTQKIRTAVVSNAKRRELEAALQTTGIGAYLEFWVSRDDVTAPKPDPNPYLTGAALLGIEPQDCWVIEDSPTGLEAGLMAGIPTIAIQTHFATRELEHPVPGRPDLRPFRIMPSMKALFEWLQELG